MNGTDLRTWRVRHRLSLRALAALIGVSTNTVHRWEMGQRPVPAMLPLALKGLEQQLAETK